jgi:hypothetical protein
MSEDWRPLVITLLILLFLAGLGTFQYHYDQPDVVSCANKSIVSVALEPLRTGQIIERELLGCDWYWFTNGPGGD